MYKDHSQTKSPMTLMFSIDVDLTSGSIRGLPINLWGHLAKYGIWYEELRIIFRPFSRVQLNALSE